MECWTETEAIDEASQTSETARPGMRDMELHGQPNAHPEFDAEIADGL
jgi:hypothetical protein